MCKMSNNLWANVAEYGFVGVMTFTYLSTKRTSESNLRGGGGGGSTETTYLYAGVAQTRAILNMFPPCNL